MIELDVMLGLPIGFFQSCVVIAFILSAAFVYLFIGFNGFGDE